MKPNHPQTSRRFVCTHSSVALKVSLLRLGLVPRKNLRIQPQTQLSAHFPSNEDFDKRARPYVRAAAPGDDHSDAPDEDHAEPEDTADDDETEDEERNVSEIIDYEIGAVYRGANNELFEYTVDGFVPYEGKEVVVTA